jgi:hypothetical protein
VLGDLIYEANQTIGIVIRNADASAVATGEVTITDNDVAPDLVLSDPTVTEGNAGSSNYAVFALSTTTPTEVGVQFDFSIQDITSAADDHGSPSGTMVLHDATGSLSIPINGDTRYEFDETFRIVLTNLSGATNASGGVATIVNDDAKPLLKVTGVSVIEQGGGWQNVLVKVSIPYPAGAPVYYDWATRDATAKAALGDYQSSSEADYEIPVGATQDFAWIRVFGDHVYEKNEAFKVAVSNVRNARVAPTSGIVLGTVTIKNDDTAPHVVFDTPSIVEGGPGQTAKLAFTGHLDAPTEVNASIRYYFAPGTATAGSDYSTTAVSPTATRSAAIKATVGTVVITLPIIGDATIEANETLSLELTTGVGVGFVDPGGQSFTGTITNDD